MRWSVLGKHIDIMNSNRPLSLKRKVFSQCVLPALKMWCGDLLGASHRLGEKAEKCTDRNVKKIAGQNMERQKANIME